MIDSLSEKHKNLFIKDHDFVLYDTYGKTLLYNCTECNAQIIIEGCLLGVMNKSNNINKGSIYLTPHNKAYTIYNLLYNKIIKQRFKYLILSCSEEIIKDIIE